MNILQISLNVIESAWLTLLDYLTFHVVLCLVPAFFIAGAMTVFLPSEVLIEYMGPQAKKRIAYPIAALSGLLLSVCSCTVIPLFVGIYKKGAGLGPAITFLFSAPAVNLLALVYTGTLIGFDIALWRAVMAIGFAVLIGLLMHYTFKLGNENKITPSNHHENSITPSSNEPSEAISAIQKVQYFSLAILVISVGVIMAISKDSLLLFSLFGTGLLAMVFLSKLKLFSSGTLFLWLVFSLLLGTSQLQPVSGQVLVIGLQVSPALANMLIKLTLEIFLLVPFIIFLKHKIPSDEISSWIVETWEFVKSIFPLILLGVVLAGAGKYFIPETLVIDYVGSNSIRANMIAVLFGIFMYFPTLMEVPIARMFLDLGMAKGPLLAYLLADPELSIQSILVTRKYLGDKKNIVYIFYVFLMTVTAGLLFGLVIGEGFEW